MSSTSSSSTLPSASSFTPLQFTGISQYSSDFQQILSRAVSIAQIPVDQMTDEQNTIMSEETTLSSLNTDVAAVTSALQTIGTLGAGGALSATSSDTSVVTATATGATAPASYTISNVTSVASAASEISSSSYGTNSNGTPVTVSANGSMILQYGSKTYPITLTSSENNVTGLAAAINNLNIGVTASILTPSGGDYLSVSADSPGATTLTLTDEPTNGTPTNILTSTNQGSDTIFTLNGNIAVDTPDTTVNNIIPGVTLSFSGKTASGETVSVDLASNSSQIESALENLVTSYNTLQSDMADQFGTSGSILSGNSILYQISNAMNSLVQYQGSNTDMGNLANLGIEISETGQMSLNSNTFNSLSTSQLTQALALFGSSTTGIGGLQQTFSQISDPVTGSVANQMTDWNTESQTLTDQIDAKNASVELLQQTINQELQAADASVADLASQQSILTANLTSLAYVDYGYNTSTSTTNGI